MNKYLLSGDKDIAQFRKAGKALRQDRFEWGILIAQGLVFFGLIAISVTLGLFLIFFPNTIKDIELAKKIFERLIIFLGGGFVLNNMDYFIKKR